MYLPKMVTYTTVAFILFGDGRLAHGCSEHRELGLLNECFCLLSGTVPDRTSVKEDNSVSVSLFDNLGDLVKDKSLNLRVVLWRFNVERGEKTLSGDLLMN